MTSDKGFKRCDGFVGSIPQNFINSNLPVCPMCGDHEPYWLLKDKMELTAHRILFRCSKCGCILSATQDDFTGTTKSTAYAVLTAGGAVNALIKHKQGKDVKTVYVKVEDAGVARISKELEGRELPLEDFQAMAAAFSQPVAPAPVVAPQHDIPMQVSYSQAPQNSSYQPQPVPMHVSYAAPSVQQTSLYHPTGNTPASHVSVSKFIFLLPLLVALAVVLLDPVVYSLQVQLFRMGGTSFWIQLASYFRNAFYTNTLLLVIPVLFWFFSKFPDMRQRFSTLLKVLCFVMLGLQAFCALLNLIFVVAQTDSFVFRSFFSLFPGSQVLIYLYHLFRVPRLRLFLNCIWELLYFVPTILCMVFSSKLKKI